MNLDPKLAICAVASVIAHMAIARALDELPPRVDLTPRKIEVRVIEAPPVPPPPPSPPPEPEKLAEPELTPPPKPVEHPARGADGHGRKGNDRGTSGGHRRHHR